MIDIVDLTKRFYFFIATTFSRHSVEVLPIDKIHLVKVQCSESKQGQNSRWFNGLIFIKIKIFFFTSKLVRIANCTPWKWQFHRNLQFQPKNLVKIYYFINFEKGCGTQKLISRQCGTVNQLICKYHVYSCGNLGLISLFYHYKKAISCIVDKSFL